MVSLILIKMKMMMGWMCRYAYATLQASSLLSKQFMLTRQQVQLLILILVKHLPCIFHISQLST